MGSRSDYLMEGLDGELRQRGYRSGKKPEEASIGRMDAVYHNGGGRLLCVERKMIPLYRAEEFRGLIGDAILRFQKEGHSVPGKRLLLAFLLARMSRNAEQDLRDYASRFLPDLQWLLMAEDGQGRIHLDERDEEVHAMRPLRRNEEIPAGISRAGLFSPKSQWLWKLLLMPGLDNRYWGGPKQKPRSVNELAELSDVSQPSVSSFLSRAEAAGFVRRLSAGFVVERHEELLEDWVYAIRHSRQEEKPLQFLYPEEPEEQWLGKVRAFCRRPVDKSSPIPLMIGSHLACHLAGIGRSNVRLPWLYVGGESADIMSALDLVKAERGNSRLALVVPLSPESVFGGCAWVDGIPICDILQCYLDVRLSRARGMEQAEVIMDRILRPHFERKK